METAVHESFARDRLSPRQTSKGLLNNDELINDLKSVIKEEDSDSGSGDSWVDDKPIKKKM